MSRNFCRYFIFLVSWFFSSFSWADYSVGLLHTWLSDDGYFQLDGGQMTDKNDHVFGLSFGLDDDLSHIVALSNQRLRYKLAYTYTDKFEATTVICNSGNPLCAQDTNIQYQSIGGGVGYRLTETSSYTLDVFANINWLFSEGRLDSREWRDRALGQAFEIRSIFVRTEQQHDPYVAFKLERLEIDASGIKATPVASSIEVGLMF